MLLHKDVSTLEYFNKDRQLTETSRNTGRENIMSEIRILIIETVWNWMDETFILLRFKFILLFHTVFASLLICVWVVVVGSELEIIS